MTNEPTNTARPQWAKNALAVFTAGTFSGARPDTMDRDDLECAIGDLICDLLHYAGQQGFDVGAVARQALGHFGLELLDEDLISLGWSVEDVREVRPDLTDEQAWEVLQQVQRRHDANVGVNWYTLEYFAEELFGGAPETDAQEAQP
jgi:hypothetical protein